MGSEQRARRRLARRGAPDSEVVTRDSAGYGGRDTLRQARNSKGPPGRPGLQVHGRAGLDYSSVHFNACTRITREAAESSGYSGSSNTKQFQSKDDVNVTAATKYDYYIGANVSGPQRYASLETRRSLENVISCDHYSNKPDLLRPLLRGERSIRRLQTAVSRVRT